MALRVVAGCSQDMVLRTAGTNALAGTVRVLVGKGANGGRMMTGSYTTIATGSFKMVVWGAESVPRCSLCQVGCGAS